MHNVEEEATGWERLDGILRHQVLPAGTSEASFVPCIASTERAADYESKSRTAAVINWN